MRWIRLSIRQDIRACKSPVKMASRLPSRNACSSTHHAERLPDDGDSPDKEIVIAAGFEEEVILDEYVCRISRLSSAPAESASGRLAGVDDQMKAASCVLRRAGNLNPPPYAIKGQRACLTTERRILRAAHRRLPAEDPVGGWKNSSEFDTRVCAVTASALPKAWRSERAFLELRRKAARRDAWRARFDATLTHEPLFSVGIFCL